MWPSQDEVPFHICATVAQQFFLVFFNASSRFIFIAANWNNEVCWWNSKISPECSFRHSATYTRGLIHQHSAGSYLICSVMKAYFFMALWAAFGEVWNITPETQFCRWKSGALFNSLYFTTFCSLRFKFIQRVLIETCVKMMRRRANWLRAAGLPMHTLRSFTYPPPHQAWLPKFPFHYSSNEARSNTENLSFCIRPLSNAHPSVLTLAVLIGKTTDVKMHPKVPSNHD